MGKWAWNAAAEQDTSHRHTTKNTGNVGDLLHLHVVVKFHLVLQPASAKDREIQVVNLSWVSTLRLLEDGKCNRRVVLRVELDDLAVHSVIEPARTCNTSAIQLW